MVGNRCLEQFFVTVEREEKAAVAGGLIMDYEDDTLQARGIIGFDIFGYGVQPTEKAPNPEHQLCYVNGFFLFAKICISGWAASTNVFLCMARRRIFRGGSGSQEKAKLCRRSPARAHHRGAASINPAGEGAKLLKTGPALTRGFGRTGMVFW